MENSELASGLKILSQTDSIDMGMREARSFCNRFVTASDCEQVNIGNC